MAAVSNNNCSICQLDFLVDKSAIKCSHCSHWVHTSCGKVTKTHLKTILALSDALDWYCPKCIPVKHTPIVIGNNIENSEVDKKIHKLTISQNSMTATVNELSIQLKSTIESLNTLVVLQAKGNDNQKTTSLTANPNPRPNKSNVNNSATFVPVRLKKNKMPYNCIMKLPNYSCSKKS